MFWRFRIQRLFEYVRWYRSFSESFLELWFYKAVPLFSRVEEDSGSAQFMLDLRVGFLELCETKTPISDSCIALVSCPPFLHS